MDHTRYYIYISLSQYYVIHDTPYATPLTHCDGRLKHLTSVLCVVVVVVHDGVGAVISVRLVGQFVVDYLLAVVRRVC